MDIKLTIKNLCKDCEDREATIARLKNGPFIVCAPCDEAWNKKQDEIYERIYDHAHATVKEMADKFYYYEERTDWIQTVVSAVIDLQANVREFR